MKSRAAGGGRGMSLEELKQAIRAADPNAVLVPPRILRRVIKHDRKMASLGLQVPHRKTYVLDANTATSILERDEMGLDVEAEAALTGSVILLAEPPPERLATMTRGQILLRYWRMLFHARIDEELEHQRRGGFLSDSIVRSRVDRIGQTVIDEARMVLRLEDYLLPPRDLWEVYREFTAVYLELRHFAPRLLGSYFPSIEDREAVDAVLAEDVNAPALFDRTRPPGAPEPAALGALIEAAADEPPPPDEAVGTCPLPAPQPARRLAERLVRRSERSDRRGNVVRAAIQLARSSKFLDPLGPPSASNPWAKARAALGELGERLVEALGLDPNEADDWRRALPALLAPASEGIWAVEARLLFDLQKLCVDYERPIYTVDLVEWLLTIGRRPIKRLLPHQRELLAVKHLRSAHRRLRHARISDPDRRRLAHLISGALHRAEVTLRDQCREPLADALRQTGFQPRTVAEHVSFDKSVEELLDKVVEQGFLTMSDLRDAVARNHVKLPDLSGAREFFRGDRLLRANRRMAVSLDGIYRRGEVYLRWLQRFSSLAFGTVVGRFLVNYVVLPFGGAFVVLFFVDHLFAVVTKQLGYGLDPEKAAEAAELVVAGAGGLIEAVETTATAAISGTGSGLGAIAAQMAETAADAVSVVAAEELLSLRREAEAAGTLDVGDHSGGLHLIPHDLEAWVWVTLVSGVFLMGLIHLPWFRRQVSRLLRSLYEVAKGVLFDFPRWVFRQHYIRLLISTRSFQLLWRMLVKPIGPALLLWLVLGLIGVAPEQARRLALGMFIAFGLVLNLRVGRDMEEITSDYLVRTWRVIRVNIFGDLFRFIMDFFARVLEYVDRLLYTVDEWLRFRGGESRVSAVIKAILGVFWFYMTYAVRFIINLLVEPQLNPIKHFPVVTVSHKVMAPLLILMIPPLAEALDDKELATTIWFLTQLLLPGVFGFLVWELKENWRLYDANRPRHLPRVLVGSHGESMSRLLRPGFHSGTLPRTFRRMRRAARKRARLPEFEVRLEQLREQRHHVEESVAHFIHRELINLLAYTRAWDDLETEIAAVESSSNRLQVFLRVAELGDEPLVLVFEHASGWILTDVDAPAWVEHLSDDRRRVLQAALAGLNQMAGVELSVPQVTHVLPPEVRSFGFSDEGLIVWVGDRFQTEATYDLTAETRLLYPSVTGPRPIPPLPTIEADRLLLDHDPITWARWVETWEAERDGQAPPEPFRRAFRLLADPEPSQAPA
ncbi:hypothetical protein AB1L88_23785 [Tautonia sp. JC769]|uniref:hypothetical protein n=1 Tax=Tautonia sp. JC769 TaxID=3232135 RepID=UPI003458080D